MIDPTHFPKLLVISAVISLAIGLIVYRFSGQWALGTATGIALFIADYVGIKTLLK